MDAWIMLNNINIVISISHSSFLFSIFFLVTLIMPLMSPDNYLCTAYLITHMLILSISFWNFLLLKALYYVSSWCRWRQENTWHYQPPFNDSVYFLSVRYAYRIKLHAFLNGYLSAKWDNYLVSCYFSHGIIVILE